MAQAGWQGLLSISELLPAYKEKHDDIRAKEVMDFMVKDESNPSSIVSCLSAARENARAVRGTLDHRGLGDAKPDLAGSQAHDQAGRL